MPRIKNFQLKIANLCLLLLISACAAPETPATTSQPSALDTQTVASIIPSNTSSPTHVATITPHLTTTPHPASTPLPTLPATERIDYFTDLILTNGYCELPCLLGITPGESTWQDVREVVEPFWDQSRLNPGETTLRYGFPHYYFETITNTPHFGMNVYGVGDSIEYITAVATIYLPGSINHSRSFAKVMQSYSLQAILNQYGAPSRVLQYILPPMERGAGNQIDIIMIYEELGFIIHYYFRNGIEWHPDALKTIICPWWEYVTIIRIYSKAPDYTKSLRSLAMLENILQSKYKDWESRSGVSIEEFTNVFVEGDERTCITFNK